ncbi:Mast/stem cell growth factor receptor kita [Orchesella cincta]|uniref:Mast/stem cell growth factor receptor kita n=1 Tax=Orchesella cincta TaxID=48709 RepID=A0A1D2N5F9_ORCCI|nr:Mast/stem cell growth factor receptor kita [Orchesella cincta]
MHFTPVLLVLLLASCVQSHDVDLFENARHEGNKTTIHVTNCSNLPVDAINTASSVNTHGRCTKFYDELDCKGHFIKIPTRSSFHHDLINWKFNDRINSVGICTDPCIPEEGQSFSKQRTNSSAFRIVLYEKPHFKGKSYPIEVDGCTPVNENVRKLRMLADTGSVRIPEGKCALVYVDSGNRDGDWNEANCSVDNEFNVYELRDGIPSLNNFEYWGVTRQYIRSVSPCQCQRSSYSDKNFTTDKPPSVVTGNESFLDKNSLWLYRRNNFRDDPVKIPLNFKGCIDLSVGEYRAWEGVAASMYISPGSCIAVHKDHDCNDAFSVEFKLSVPDLSEYNLDSAIRSLSTCSTEVAELSGSCENLVLYTLCLVGFLIICVVLLIALGLMLKRKYKIKYKTIMETLTDKEIDEFLQGLGLELEDESDNVSVSDSRAASIAELGNETESLKFSSDLLAQNQPYNFQLEIPRTQLNYDIKCALGSGEYGIVYKGTLEKANINIPVAIKTMKPYSNGEGLRALLKEVKVMMYVGQHPKIVKLEGCCTNNLRQGTNSGYLYNCSNNCPSQLILNSNSQVNF